MKLKSLPNGRWCTLLPRLSRSSPTILGTAPFVTWYSACFRRAGFGLPAGRDGGVCGGRGDPGARLIDFGIGGRGIIHAHSRPAAMRTHRVHQVRREVRRACSSFGGSVPARAAGASRPSLSAQPGCPRSLVSSPFPGIGSRHTGRLGGGVARGWRFSWPMLSLVFPS